MCRHQNVSGGMCRLDSHLPSLSVIRMDKRCSGGGSWLAVEGGVVPVLYVPLGTAETCEGGQPPQGNLTIPGGPALCPDDLLCGQWHRTQSCGTDTKVPVSRTSARGWWCTQLGSVRGWTSACISHCQAPCQECPLSWVMTLTRVVAGAVTVVTGVEGEDGGSGAV